MAFFDINAEFPASFQYIMQQMTMSLETQEIPNPAAVWINERFRCILRMRVYADIKQVNSISGVSSEIGDFDVWPIYFNGGDEVSQKPGASYINNQWRLLDQGVEPISLNGGLTNRLFFDFTATSEWEDLDWEKPTDLNDILITAEQKEDIYKYEYTGAPTEIRQKTGLAFGDGARESRATLTVRRSREIFNMRDLDIPAGLYTKDELTGRYNGGTDLPIEPGNGFTDFKLMSVSLVSQAGEGSTSYIHREHWASKSLWATYKK